MSASAGWHRLFLGPPAVPVPLRRVLPGSASVAATVVAVLAVLVSGHATAEPVDESVQHAVWGLLPDARGFALRIDFLGEPVVATLLTVLLAVGCLVAGRRRLAVLALTGPASTGVVTTVLKPVVGRTIHGPNLAYPSGHTAALTGLALVCALLVVSLAAVPKTGGLTLVLGAAGLAGLVMGLSQITLDAHYPTDVLGGICVAVAVVPMVARLVDTIGDRSAR